VNKKIILLGIIGIIVISAILSINSTTTINKDPTVDTYKIGIVQWVTNEEFEKNIRI